MFKPKHAALLLAWVIAGQAQAEQLSDPTRRPSAASTTISTGRASAWLLQSTQLSGQRRSAVINGQTVRVGDVVNRDGQGCPSVAGAGCAGATARVLQIEHGRVVLNVAGQRTTVSMFTAIGKSSAPAPVRPKLGSQE